MIRSSGGPSHRLAASPPFGYELSTYVRYQRSVVLTAPEPITWQWITPRPTPPPRVRLWAQNVATDERHYLSDWLTGNPESYGGLAKYLGTVDLPTGDYLLSADIEGLPLDYARPFDVPIRMQRELPVTGQTHVAVVSMRHESGSLGAGSACVPVPATPPIPFSTPARLRVATPHSTYLPASQLWHSHMAPMAAWLRQLSVTERVLGTQRLEVITSHANKEQYKEAEISAHWNLPLIDGPRGVGTTGMVGHIAPRAYADPETGGPMSRGKRGWSWWMIATHGRLFELWETGQIDTVIGWRLKPGVFPPDWQMADDSASSPLHDPEWVKAHYEFLGNWIDCTPDLFEPWGTCVRALPEAGHHGHAVEHEGWVTDSFNHRILYVNHMTAHGAEHYAPAAWAPNGYVSPAAPHGQADVLHCGGNRDRTPMGRLCDAPWGLTDVYPAHLPDAAEHEDRIAFTNYWGDSICWLNIRTGEITPIVVSRAHLEPDAAEIRNNRAIWGRARSDALFDAHVNTMDWVDFGQASFIRPAAIAHRSDGMLDVISEGMSAIFRVDWRNGRMKCIRRSLKSGSSLTLSTLAVDWRGESGPKDHIRYGRWAAGSTGAITEDGVLLGGGLQTAGGIRVLEGPANQVQAGGYISAFSMRGGNVVVADSGTHALFRLTQKLPTDPVLDTARYLRGTAAWTGGTDPPLALAHGNSGQGRLGLPTGYEMATWDDATLDGYLVAHGLTGAEAADVRYMLRWDLSGDSPPDPVEPEPPKTIHVMADITTVPAGEGYRTRVQLLDAAGEVVSEHASEPVTITGDPSATAEVQEPSNTVMP